MMKSKNRWNWLFLLLAAAMLIHIFAVPRAVSYVLSRDKDQVQVYESNIL